MQWASCSGLVTAGWSRRAGRGCPAKADRQPGYLATWYLRPAVETRGISGTEHPLERILEMRAHRLPRCRAVLTANRLEHGHMFGLHEPLPLHRFHERKIARQIHAEQNLFFDERHHRDEKRVLRGARHREVEHEIVLRADAPGFDDAFQLIPRMLDRGNVVRIGF